MGLDKNKIEYIECFTWDLLKDIYKDDVIIPPIDLDRLANNAGIEIKQGNFENPEISGAYEKNKKIIYINESDSYVRKAFTFAHELGHFYLHKNKPTETFFRSDMQSIEEEHRQVEQEANWFAASILMPKKPLVQLWDFTRDIQELARRCEVSSLALHYRLKNLGLLN